jgi:hypothetical protein
MGRGKEQMLRRTLAVLGAVVTMAVMLVVTSAVGTAQATTEKFNVRTYASFVLTEENPHCPGQEDIKVEGFFHQVTQITAVDLPNTEPGTDIYKNTGRSNSSNVIGTGLVTGNAYRFINTGGVAETLLFPEATPQGIVYTGTEENSYRIISPGVSPNFTLHVTSKIVLDENQEPIITIENVRVSCD